MQPLQACSRCQRARNPLLGAGGAFPEIHVAQYPLDMGRPDKGPGGGAGGGDGKTLALTVNAEGDINYDAVLSQSKNAQKWLQTTHKALVPKPDLLLSDVGVGGGGGLLCRVSQFSGVLEARSVSPQGCLLLPALPTGAGCPGRPVGSDEAEAMPREVAPFALR